jgi:hypothetical protein
MEFFIKKNTNLPLLKMQIVKDGRQDYQSFMELIEKSSIVFSMQDIDTGTPKIISKRGGYVSKTFIDENTPTEYYIYYKFTKKDTNKAGRYEGQFLLRSEYGDLIVPIREKLYINVEDSYSVSETLFTENLVVNNQLPYPLGREYVKDERDMNYLIENHFESVYKKNSNIKTKYWNADVWWGDQGRTPQCVGYAWCHWIEDGPIVHKGLHPLIAPNLIYESAQKLDEWPGENYKGTSVRAGAKFLKNKKLISSYFWTFDVNTLINTVLNVGPVVVGTNWYYNMFFPGLKGQIKIGGYLAGGHAYVINGVNLINKTFRIKNSWGRKWGDSGHAYISFNDMTRLIRENGEVCIAREIPT